MANVKGFRAREVVGVKGFRGDPTARPRRDPDAALLQAQEVVRRHGAGESVRVIARAVGLPRTSVHRLIQQWRDAQRQNELDDLDSENAALLAKFEAGSAPGLVLADADPVLVARLRERGVDLGHPDTLDLLADYTADPNPLHKFRLGHAPRTARGVIAG